MKPETKFRIRTYLYYLLVEPFTEKVNFPNTRTLSWIILLLGFFLKITPLFFLGIISGVFSYLYWEYKSGKYIYWYRNRKFKEQREALKKIREEKKNGDINEG